MFDDQEFEGRHKVSDFDFQDHEFASTSMYLSKRSRVDHCDDFVLGPECKDKEPADCGEFNFLFHLPARQNDAFEFSYFSESENPMMNHPSFTSTTRAGYTSSIPNSPQAETQGSNSTQAAVTEEGEAASPVKQDSWEEQLELMMNNGEECNKKILKHFLMESILNESIHGDRFDLLTEKSKVLARIFMKECFGFDVPSSIASRDRKGGTVVLVLINKQNQDENFFDKKLQRQFNSLAFYVEAYLYYLDKQVGGGSPEHDPERSERMLADVLFPADSSKLSKTAKQKNKKFREVLRTLKDPSNYARYEQVKNELPECFARKMKQLSIKSLRKFYAVKLQKYFEELIDINCINTPLGNRFLNLHAKIDLFSNLLLSPIQNNSYTYYTL